MEVEGKIIQKLPLQSGTSKAGNAWSKQIYVLETVHDSYPRKIAFDFFGERVNQYPLEVGDSVRLSFDVESREFQGRWYTDIRGWKAEKIDLNAAPAQAPAQAPANQPYEQAPMPEGSTPANGPAPAPDLTQQPEDDLPF